MSAEERQEIAHIMGLIVGCLNETHGVSQSYLNRLIDAVNEFTIKSVLKDRGDRMSTEASPVGTEEKRKWLLEVFLTWIKSKDYHGEFWMARYRERISTAEGAWIEGLYQEVEKKVPENWK